MTRAQGRARARRRGSVSGSEESSRCTAVSDRVVWIFSDRVVWIFAVVLCIFTNQQMVVEQSAQLDTLSHRV